MDKKPLGTREHLKMTFPGWAWFIDYVLAPFPDELGRFGWEIVMMKWLIVVRIGAFFLNAVVPVQYGRVGAIGLIWIGITGLAYSLFGRWDS